MIKTTDLRIGNLIKDAYGDIIKVETLQGDCIDLDVEPILLTPEILLKAGFEKMPHFTVMNSMIYDLGRGRQLSIGCIGTPNEMLFLKDGESLCVLHNWDYDGPLYLHKLQNIIFALASTELKIDPLTQ